MLQPLLYGNGPQKLGSVCCRKTRKQEGLPLRGASKPISHVTPRNSIKQDRGSWGSIKEPAMQYYMVTLLPSTATDKTPNTSSHKIVPPPPPGSFLPAPTFTPPSAWHHTKAYRTATLPSLPARMTIQHATLLKTVLLRARRRCLCEAGRQDAPKTKFSTRAKTDFLVLERSITRARQIRTTKIS